MENQDQALRKFEDPEAYLAEIESRTLVFHKIIVVAVKNTLPTDWIDYDGKPAVSAPGAERIARSLGFTVKDANYWKEEKEDEQGKYFIYFWRGKVGLENQNMFIEAIGGQSSRKPFWYIDKGRKRLLSEVNEVDILKDAYSDMIRNGVTRFLGIRGLTWEFLNEQGITVQRAKQVKFKEKPTPGAQLKKTQGETVQESKKADQGRDQIVNVAIKKVLASRQQIENVLPKELRPPMVARILKDLNAQEKEMDLATFERYLTGVEHMGGA